MRIHAIFALIAATAVSTTTAQGELDERDVLESIRNFGETFASQVSNTFASATAAVANVFDPDDNANTNASPQPTGASSSGTSLTGEALPNTRPEITLISMIALMTVTSVTYL